MTDETYETESLHTPESRDRDARFVGHEVKADISKEAIAEILDALDRILDEEIDVEVSAARRMIAALEAENQRLRAALKGDSDD